MPHLPSRRSSCSHNRIHIVKYQSNLAMRENLQQSKGILDSAGRTVLDNPNQVEYPDQHREKVLQAILDLRR